MDPVLRKQLYEALTSGRPEFEDSPHLAQRVKEVTELDLDAIEPVIDAEIARVRETKVNP